MANLNFDGRVAVVTGAGAGLGRAYALLFASRGAKVVVNDLGVDRHGKGKGSAAADSVVAEIRKNGGIAVPDYNSVVEGEKIIQTALDNFGRVDILVNNAGILRDKSFARISDQDWDLIHAVHLKGSFKTTQAAWPIFKKQNYGRIIMTASNSGLYGNFGQANYSAAKLGLVGLANTVAIEGAKNNIHCNVIVPTAASRLTEDILPPDLFKELKPEYIAPVVAYLCHESCQENGVIIDSALGWAGRTYFVRGAGSFFRRKDASVTIEDVRDAWPKILDMSKAKRFESISEVTASLMSALNEEGDSGSGSDVPFKFTNQSCILYALAVGASVENPNHLQYLYENHENFKPLPGFFVLPGQMTIMSSSVSADALPHATVSPANILHGEQYLEIVGPMPTEGELRSDVKVADVLDKGSGAVVIVDFDTYNDSELIVKGQMSIFVVGAGGFGGPRTSTKAIEAKNPPNRKHDAVVEEKTSVNSAALYRLCGDSNPLHIDSNIAQMAGFKQPILHGLCTVGYSVRHVLDQYADGDGSLFKAYKVRFSKPVIPGQTLRTLMWREGNRIYFSTEVKETGQQVIAGAYVDLKEVKMTVETKPVSAEKLESDAIFEKIIDGVKAEPAKAKSVNGVFVYNITKNGKQVKQWTLDLKKGEVYEGAPKGVKPDTTITISDGDFIDLAFGKLQPQAAYMRGKLKITGNVMLTQKLIPLLKSGPKL